MKVKAGLVLMSLIAMCSCLQGGPEEDIKPPPSLDDPIVTRAFNLVVEDYRKHKDYRVRKALGPIQATRQVLSQIGAGVKYKVWLTVRIVDNGEEHTCIVTYVDQPVLPPGKALDGHVNCLYL